jgi:hypothetical protein
MDIQVYELKTAFTTSEANWGITSSFAPLYFN